MHTSDRSTHPRNQPLGISHHKFVYYLRLQNQWFNAILFQDRKQTFHAFAACTLVLHMRHALTDNTDMK